MATLSDLPAELLSRIASHLFHLDPQFHDKFEDTGFCNLRLSCRCLELKTRYSFEKAAFATRVVTLRAQSLSRLRDISYHSRFGKLIKKLVFCKVNHPVYDGDVAPLELGGLFRRHEHAGYGVIELPKHGVDGVYPNEGLSLRKRVRLGLQDCLATITAVTSNLRDVVIEPNFMASFWLDSPSRQEQLNERARHIYESTRESNARERERYEQEGYESEDAEETDSDFDVVDGENEDYDNDDVDDPYNLESYVYPDYLLYLVARAAQWNGLKLSLLSSINVTASSIRARTFVEVAPALQSLRHLSISVNASNVTKLRRMNGSALHDHGNGQPTARTFGHALSTLRDLQSLTLAFDGYYWEDDRNANISKSLRGLSDHSFEHLDAVDFDLASFEGKGLYNFLYKHKSRLRRLLLCRITLATIEHWRPILTMMLEDMPMLTAARCAELTGGEGFGDTTLSLNRTEGWKGCCIMDCSDRQEMAVELKRALDHFPGASP